MRVKTRNEFDRAADSRALRRSGRAGFDRAFAAGMLALAATVAALGIASIESRPHAIEARLIGECHGRLLAAMEESSFPAGCAWIEPIRMESDAQPTAFKELTRAAVVDVRLVESR